ncbi:MAG: dihydroneopterin aldolase [Gemmatimonadota bacterium]|nr:MAG: dihydroneopterin aldolase [Gemmatimonadota bacterium]
MRDRVFLEEGRVLARIGVTETERLEPQELIIDLSWTPGRGNAENDDLSEVIDYAAVWESVLGVLEGREFKLIETVAEEVAATLLGRFPMPDISVRIRKPAALAHLNVAAAGVEIQRRALDPGA